MRSACGNVQGRRGLCGADAACRDRLDGGGANAAGDDLHTIHMLGLTRTSHRAYTLAVAAVVDVPRCTSSSPPSYRAYCRPPPKHDAPRPR
jgi:hypothetical protein